MNNGMSGLLLPGTAQGRPGSPSSIWNTCSKKTSNQEITRMWDCCCISITSDVSTQFSLHSLNYDYSRFLRSSWRWRRGWRDREWKSTSMTEVKAGIEGALTRRGCRMKSRMTLWISKSLAFPQLYFSHIWIPRQIALSVVVHDPLKKVLWDWHQKGFLQYLSLLTLLFLSCFRKPQSQAEIDCTFHVSSSIRFHR